MLNTSIFYDSNNIIEGLVIKCINFNKIVDYELEEQTLNKVITVLVTIVVFPHIRLSWII